MSILLLFGLLSASVLIAWALALTILQGLLWLLTGVKTSAARSSNMVGSALVWHVPGAAVVDARTEIPRRGALAVEN